MHIASRHARVVSGTIFPKSCQDGTDAAPPIRKDAKMKSLVSHLRAAARNRVAYLRTVAELSRLPLDTRLDLDIYAGDVRRIAHRAVYGA
jgi:hypothetical protein